MSRTRIDEADGESPHRVSDASPASRLLCDGFLSRRTVSRTSIDGRSLRLVVMETRLATSATIDAKDDDDGWDAKDDNNGGRRCIGRELRAHQGCGTELRAGTWRQEQR